MLGWRGRGSCGSLGGGRFTRLSPHSLAVLRRFGRFVPLLAGVAALPLPSLRLWCWLITSGVRSRCCRLAVSVGPLCRLSLLLLGVFGGPARAAGLAPRDQLILSVIVLGAGPARLTGAGSA